MTIYAGSEMMGNYFSAAYFSVLLTFISLPISTALFPTFSKLNAEREPRLVQMVFASSVKYTSILLVTATIALIALSTPLIGNLFLKTAFSSPFLLQQSL
jgi:O-antigen/teichoic acid export membrane protein